MKTKYQRLCFTLAIAVCQITTTRALDPNPQSLPVDQKKQSAPATDQKQNLVPTLKIIHFNVGNGDATLVVVETGQTKKSLLIDGGTWEMAGKVVIPGIRQELQSGLDYAVATHYDAEHRDGLERVVRSVGMSGSGAVYDRDRVWLSNPGQKPENAEDNAKERPLQPGSRILLDPQIVIECVAANGDTKGWRWTTQDPPLDENAESLAFLITFRKFRYFIGGDLTGGGRSGWSTTPNIESAVAGDVGQVSVLHVNHHGSRTSTNSVFLNALNPTVAIISTGRDPKNGQYHWPCREVLDRLNALSHLSAVYITGEADTPKGLTLDDKKKIKSDQGNITVSTTGEGSFKVNETSYPL